MLSLVLVVVGLVDPSVPPPRPQIVASSSLQELVLTDGKHLRGVVEQVVDDRVVLRDTNGDRRDVDASQIVTVRVVTTESASSWTRIRRGVRISVAPDC